MSLVTRLDRLDRLLIRGIVGVGFSALIVATAGSEAVRPLLAGSEAADTGPAATQQDSRRTDTGAKVMRNALCARYDPPATTFNRNS